MDIAELLEEQEHLTNEFMADETAHENSKFSERAYCVYRFLQISRPLASRQRLRLREMMAAAATSLVPRSVVYPALTRLPSRTAPFTIRT